MYCLRFISKRTKSELNFVAKRKTIFFYYVLYIIYIIYYTIQYICILYLYIFLWKILLNIRLYVGSFVVFMLCIQCFFFISSSHSPFFHSFTTSAKVFATLCAQMCWQNFISNNKRWKKNLCKKHYVNTCRQL